ncbi:MAG: 2'-5' RNA ligase family protein [Rhodanobacteraceae bacterium]
MPPESRSRPATDRFFFAVFPAPDSAARIAALAQTLRRQHGLRGKPLAAARLHVTLHHLGDYAGLPPTLVASAEAAAARVNLPAFDVAFDSASSFAGRSRQRPLVLRCKETDMASLWALQRMLGEGMAATGLSRHVERTFVPHVTLAYDDKLLTPTPIERIGWTVRDFVLVRSLIGRGEYRALGRWPLFENP